MASDHDAVLMTKEEILFRRREAESINCRQVYGEVSRESYARFMEAARNCPALAYD